MIKDKEDLEIGAEEELDGEDLPQNEKVINLLMNNSGFLGAILSVVHKKLAVQEEEDGNDTERLDNMAW